ncbi:ceramidase domain-containing protein [Pseudomaricurvus sp. HS19]|uniref:ceramidase domain-containing protein n=1 Tax=Pseudomaricurvus sp. HS19 TaxID=2692626 RepID=UPI0013679C31|nr:ceramidase domain-containing protein [Pseudomaricurvus sp. HS19]MYM63104.1 alkaline phytoceramidase [Pseudomaricurvus sp. HS19]
MDWTQSLDEYCERLTAEFWAEPLNALSNISFLIAAVAAWHWGHKRQQHTTSSYWLVLLLLMVGIGSFLYHTFADRWSRVADLLPIYLYQLSFITVYSLALARRAGLAPLPTSSLTLTAFVAITLLFGLLPKHWLNGSVTYLSAWLFLLGIAVAHRRLASSGRNLMLAAVGLFTLSLTFRSLDMVLCDQWPAGTHFLWHLVNGLMLYLTLRSYLAMQQSNQQHK